MLDRVPLVPPTTVLSIEFDAPEQTMPIIKQVRESRVNPTSQRLNAFAYNVTSQCGEDGVIEKIFEVIGPGGKWCVEFGAWDGKHYSNTYNLIQNHGWHGVLIEGNQQRFNELRRTYEGNDRARLVCEIVGFDPNADSLDHILATVPDCPNSIDLISIDIDGNDYHVFESLVTFKPRLVVIEFNPTVPNDVLFVQDRDFSVNQGCSLRALIELGKKKGYELVAVTRFNAFFIVAEEFSKFEIPDNSIDAMYEPTMDGRVFHGYDGKIYSVGMDRLAWHGASIASDRLQILPPERRVYRDSLPRHTSVQAPRVGGVAGEDLKGDQRAAAGTQHTDHHRELIRAVIRRFVVRLRRRLRRAARR